MVTINLNWMKMPFLIKNCDLYAVCTFIITGFFLIFKKNLSKAVIFALSLLSSLVFFNQTSLTKSSYLQVPSAMMVSMSSWEISVMARDVPVLSKELKSPRLILLKLGMAKMENYLLKKSMISLMLSLMILTRMNCDCEKQNF